MLFRQWCTKRVRQRVFWTTFCIRSFGNVHRSCSLRHRQKHPNHDIILIRPEGSLEHLHLSPESFDKFDIHYRDFLSLELTTNKFQISNPILAFIRKKSLIFSFAVKGTLHEDSLILFEPHLPVTKEFANHICTRLLDDKEEKKKVTLDDTTTDSLDSFCVACIEEVLEETCSIYDRRQRLFAPILDTLLGKTSSDGAFEGVHKLVPFQDSLQAFELEVKSARETVLDLLDNTNHLPGAAINQTSGDMHLVLESYANRLSTDLNNIIYHQRKLQTRISSANMQMVLHRNRIMRLNLQTGIAAVSIGTGSLLAGMAGMNVIDIENQLPTVNFYVVCGSIFLLAATVHKSIGYYMLGVNRDKEREVLAVQDLKIILGDVHRFDHAIKTAFRTIDTDINRNRDGVGLAEQGNESRLSKEEFMEIFHRSDTGMSKSQVQTLYDMLDTNNDGYLVQSEIDRNLLNNKK